MKRSWEITITLKNKKTVVHHAEAVAGYRVMPEGYLLVQLNDLEEEKGESLDVSYDRFYYPISEILKFHVLERVVFPDELAVLKYRKFKAHGISMVHQEVSQTVKDPAKVAQEVEKDKHIQILTQKKQRITNQRKKIN